MDPVDIAIVTRDPRIRDRAARAFDGAPASWHIGLYDEIPPGASIVVTGPDVPAARDAIAFDGGDAAALLDAVTRSLATTSGRVVAVTSASGGVGVTSVALHIAAHARRSPRVCVLDLDRTWGIGTRLGIDDGAVPTWGSLGEEMDLATAALPVGGGFRVLLAPQEPETSPVANVVAQARRHFDAVIVDCPGSQLPAIVDHIDIAVMVVVPTASGILRAGSFVDRWPEVTWAIVTNRLGPGSDLTRRDLERRLGKSIALELPTCPGLRDAEDSCALFTAWWSRWPRAIAALAEAVLE